MKRTLFLLAAVCLASAAWGHVPADRTFLAFQWPDSMVPTIDGNLEEWEVIPEVYAITIEDTHEELYSTAIDKSDFDFRGWVGYNANSDKLIIATRVFDDYHERDNTSGADCACSDDNFEMVVDGDHAGDGYRSPVPDNATAEERQQATNDKAQWWSMAVPPVEGRTVMSGGNGAWQYLPPYFDLQYTFEGEEHGESTYYYEMSFYPWDYMDNLNGPDASTPTDLVEGNIIGLNLIWSDFDGPLHDQPLLDSGATQYDGYWISGGSCCDGTNTSDFLLAPVEDSMTAVETDTWGRLKARFQ